MPIALIAGVVIVIVGAVGFVVTRDANVPEEVAVVDDTANRTPNDPADDMDADDDGDGLSDGSEEEMNQRGEGTMDEYEVEHDVAAGQVAAPDEGDTSGAAESLPAPELPADDPAVSGMNDDVAADETVTSGVADGEYTASASYFTPSNVEHDIGVTLTIESGEVADVAVTYNDAAAETGHHQRFDAAVADDVIGVPLEDVQLSRTGGASLTSGAFNEAVDTIKQQAAA
jgi:AAA ATPase containing von Willebrand factor type A (vWA) domain